MGLASALAAQAGGAPPAQQAYGGQQQATYGMPPAPAPGTYPPIGGQPPAGAAYTGFPPAGAPPQQPPGHDAGMASVVAAKLAKTAAANQLQAFWPPDRLSALTQRITQRVDFRALAARWRMPVELAVDLASLALYDVVIYADDSGSMESDNGERIDDLELIMAKVSEVATLFDDDGIEVRFINSNVQGNGIKTAADASRLLRHLEYRYDTKIATQLEAKILGPMAYSRRLNKPLLIITITDGEPSDKPADKIFSVIGDCIARLAPQYGPHAVAFQFAQVGKDQEAQEFLGRLDKHPQIGKMVDCTSYFELECAEYARKGITLSPEAWLVKLMVGAIDPDYDEQDEAAGQAPPPHHYHQAQQPAGGYSYPPPQAQAFAQQPAGGYGAYQAQQYQQPPAGYSQPGYGGGGHAFSSQQAGAYPPGAGYQQQHQQGAKPKKSMLDKIAKFLG